MSERARDTAVVWLVRLSVAAGVVWTAVSEWQLARIIGAPSWVAPALPLAIDAYVVAAVRAGRRPDLAFALTIMSCAQIAARLLDAGQVQVSVTLVAFVSILVPLTIWRVHALADSDHANQEAESAVASANRPVGVPNPEKVQAPAAVRTNLPAEVPNRPANPGANQVLNLPEPAANLAPNPAAEPRANQVQVAAEPAPKPTPEPAQPKSVNLARTEPKPTKPKTVPKRPAPSTPTNPGIPPVLDQVQQILDLIDEHGYDTVKLGFVMEQTGMKKTAAYNTLVEARGTWQERQDKQSGDNDS